MTKTIYSWGEGFHNELWNLCCDDQLRNDINVVWEFDWSNDLAYVYIDELLVYTLDLKHKAIVSRHLFTGSILDEEYMERMTAFFDKWTTMSTPDESVNP